MNIPKSNPSSSKNNIYDRRIAIKNNIVKIKNFISSKKYLENLCYDKKRTKERLNQKELILKEIEKRISILEQYTFKFGG